MPLHGRTDNIVKQNIYFFINPLVSKVGSGIIHSPTPLPKR